jgi:hypothetical protein
METIVRFNVKKMKEDIKIKVEEQKFLKNQRKTVHIIGERKLSHWEATCNHQNNREDLRIMYAVYGLNRGKTFNEIENHYLEENHPLKQYQKTIDRVTEEYMEIVEVEI